MAFNETKYSEACAKLRTMKPGTPEYDRQFNLCLNLKWAGCPLKEFNPKGL